MAEQKKVSETVVKSDRTVVKGQEIWRVRAPAGTLTLKTSASSTTIIDGAVKLYGDALKRLGKR
jgi:hypothetical protein